MGVRPAFDSLLSAPWASRGVQVSLLLLSEARATSGNPRVLTCRRDHSSNQAQGRGQSAGRACRQEGTLRPMRERQGAAGAGRRVRRAYEGAAGATGGGERSAPSFEGAAWGGGGGERSAPGL